MDSVPTRKTYKGCFRSISALFRLQFDPSDRGERREVDRTFPSVSDFSIDHICPGWYDIDIAYLYRLFLISFTVLLSEPRRRLPLSILELFQDGHQ